MYSSVVVDTPAPRPRLVNPELLVIRSPQHSLPDLTQAIPQITASPSELWADYKGYVINLLIAAFMVFLLYAFCMMALAEREGVALRQSMEPYDPIKAYNFFQWV